MLRRIAGVLGILAAVTAAAAPPAGKTGTVSFHKVRFDTQGLAYAADPRPKFLQASPYHADEPPGSEWPAHVEFAFPHFYESLPLDKSHGEEPLIQVYPTADFARLKWDGEQKDLKALLKQRAAGNAVLMRKKPLPFLPVADAEQVIHANAVFVAFHKGWGIRYITCYAQDVSPFTADSCFYTFQGLTDDGKTYISAQFSLSTPLLPKKFPENFDYKAFEKGYTAYLASTTKKLNAANSAHDFTPAPADLDRLLASLEVDTPAPPHK